MTARPRAAGRPRTPDARPQSQDLPPSLTARVIAFCRALRRAGLRTGPGDSALALQALGTVDLGDPRDFYLALRTVLVRRREEEPVFDRLFAVYFDLSLVSLPAPPPEAGEEDPGTPAELEPEAGAGQLSLEEWGRGDGDGAEEAQTAAYSPAEQLGRRDFADLGDEDLARVERQVANIGRHLATRRSRRYQPSRRGGRLDLRRIIRLSVAAGGEPLQLCRRRRKVSRHHIIVLLDVSRSMALYTRFLMQLLYALQIRLRGVETFVFSTRLTRVTPWLKKAGFHHAKLGLASLAAGWSGGTRIGESLDRFVAVYGPRLLDRRSVVIILSDGWDMGDPDLVSRAMAAIRRRARRVVWLNPLLGSPGYQPETRGMKAALPYIDIFAPAHNVESLKRLERLLLRHGGVGT